MRHSILTLAILGLATIATGVAQPARAMEMSLNTTENFGPDRTRQVQASQQDEPTLQSQLIDQLNSSGNGDQYATSTPNATTDFNSVAPAAGNCTIGGDCRGISGGKRADNGGFNE